MLADEYGNDLSTGSTRARDAYDLGVRRFLGAEPGVADAFSSALEVDDGLALAHIGLAREMHMRGQPDKAIAHLAEARARSGELTVREKSHLEVNGLLIEGKSAKARAAVYEHIADWPTDVMVAMMCTSVFGLIGLSGIPGREAEQLAYTSRLEPHYGDNWWFRAQLAFAQLEVGQLAAAEKNIEIALVNNPNSAHSAHIKAHVYYEGMQDEEGFHYITDWWRNYDPETTFYNHVSWHVGLWALETGDLDLMWQVLDTAIAPESSHGPPLNVLTDTVALFFRAELMGVEVPAQRWKKMSDYALARFPKPGVAFADVHAAIAHGRCGNREALSKLIDEPGGPAKDVCESLARAYAEMQDQNWSKAAEYFQDSLHDHARIGGSNAQRDVIDFALAACLIRDGRRDEARTVLRITRPRAMAYGLVAGL